MGLSLLSRLPGFGNTSFCCGVKLASFLGLYCNQLHRLPSSALNVCLGLWSNQFTLKHLPQPLRSHIQSFRTIGQLLKIQMHNVGFPLYFFCGIQLFVNVNYEPVGNFRTLGQPPYWKKVNTELPLKVDTTFQGYIFFRKG